MSTNRIAKDLLGGAVESTMKRKVINNAASDLLGEPNAGVMDRVKNASEDVKDAVSSTVNSRRLKTKNKVANNALNNTGDADVAKDIMDNASSKNGLGLFRLAKKHPGIAVGAIMGTAWGVSEITDESEF